MNHAAPFPSGLPFEVRVRSEFAIPGSPERCIRRMVVSSRQDENALFVLEAIHPSQLAPRESIARNLARLQAAGMNGLLPYLRFADGAYVLSEGGALWQLSPFYEAEPLPRPEFIHDPERGTSLARMLVSLREASANLDLEDARPGFSLAEYCATLLARFREREPEAFARLSPCLPRIKTTLQALPDHALAFCHGDFHPLNVLWEGTEAQRLIDWEFCGLRPKLYDCANLVGCVGMEDPQALGRGLVPAFVGCLRREGLMKTQDAALQAELLPIVRIAWLSEWLRKNDREMLDLELDYIALLVDHERDFIRAWS